MFRQFDGLEHSGVNTVPGRKHNSNDFIEANVAAHRSEKGYRDISKQFEVHRSTLRKIIHEWKTFKASFPKSGHSRKFTSRSVLRETAKKSRDFQASVGILNIKVHDSIQFKKD